MCFFPFAEDEIDETFGVNVQFEDSDEDVSKSATKGDEREWGFKKFEG